MEIVLGKIYDIDENVKMNCVKEELIRNEADTTFKLITIKNK